MVYTGKNDEFIISQGFRGFIGYNTKKEWENGHSHLKSLKAAKTGNQLGAERQA